MRDGAFGIGEQKGEGLFDRPRSGGRRRRWWRRSRELKGKNGVSPGPQGRQDRAWDIFPSGWRYGVQRRIGLLRQFVGHDGRSERKRAGMINSRLDGLFIGVGRNGNRDAK